MTTLLAHITVKPGWEDRFEALAADLYRESHANEPACRRYEYWRGQDQSTYYVLLSFEDFDGFMTHQVADYHHDAGPALNECFAAFRLEYIDPLPAASPLAAGQTTAPVPEGASERWQGYVERHQMPLPSWWQQRRG